MRNKAKFLAVALIAGGTMFAQPFRPPCPGPGYTWSDGYWHAPVARVIPRDVPVRHFDDHRFNDRDRDRHDFAARDREHDRRDFHR